MIVGLEIECYSCAELLVVWLKKQKEELNKYLRTNLKDRAITENHQIQSIGFVKATVEMESK